MSNHDPTRGLLVAAAAGAACWCIVGVIVWAWWSGAAR